MKNIISFSATAALLAGCGTIPTQLAQSNVTPREIMRAIKCEIAYALASGQGDVGYFADWNAAVQLETKLIDHATAKPGLTVSGKVNDVEWKSPTGIDYSDMRTGTAIIKYNVIGLESATTDACPLRGSTLAATGLGLADWLERAGMTFTPDTSDNGTIDTLKYDITFSVERSVGGGLTFKTDHLDFALDENSISRRSENTLNMAFAAPPPPVVKPKGKGVAPKGKSVEQLQQEITEERQRQNVITVDPGQKIIIE